MAPFFDESLTCLFVREDKGLDDFASIVYFLAFRNAEACFQQGASAKMTDESVVKIARVVLRFALASAFLVTVADRLGILGVYGSRNVSWGDWHHFEDYVAVLNWFVPKAMIPGLSAIETAVEAGLGIGLLAGIYPRIIAWSSAVLLSSFALTMTVALGILAPLNYGVFTAAGAALLLGGISPSPSRRQRAR